MKIFPAIDIRQGRVVRLTYGDYGQQTTYDLTPEQAAQGFVDAGATCLHMVDLDGAKDGASGNFGPISAVLGATPLFTQVGGGIRNLDTLQAYLDAGADRVILGTAALHDQDFLLLALNLYGDKIAVGVDARNSRVAVAGWMEASDQDSFEFCADLQSLGVRTIIYTDISRDGAMQGCNMEAYRRLSKLRGVDIVASGGVSTLDEIRSLSEMGIYGCIIGKALYNGTIDLRQALAAAERKVNG